ncbi:MAG: glycosyltransferase, partial [Anaerolineae bacterium]|nr:glycosyltransferase [Anaerolineae bacterium]
GILAQTRQPDEVILVDGGSTDHTTDVIRSYEDRLPLRLFIEPGCNISQGRNKAIREAQGEILAITDAGVRLPHDWLETITQPLRDVPSLNVSCGFFAADPQTVFEVAMGATVLPLVNEIDPLTFLPSSRSIAVRKSAALQVDGYPEWLDYCEDLIFDLRLKDTQPPFAFVPDAAVWFRPRRTLSSYFKQYYLYARGDGKADLWRKRHALRYLTYLVAAPALLLGGWLLHPALWLLLIAGGVVYLRQPYRRLPEVMARLEQVSALDWLQAWLLIPLIRLVGDIAKMIGYPVGWGWRWKHHPPEWRIAAER